MLELTVTEPTVQTLVSLAQGGDRGAFDLLVSRLEGRLREKLGRRLGPKVRARLELDDVLQETFLRAWGSLARFQWRDEAGLVRWLEAIAENCLRDALKGPRGDDVLELRDAPQPEAVSPSRNARREERFDRLEASLERLSADHRQVIRLARIEGLKIKEVARRMGRSESAVKNLLLRALRELKSTFGDTESLRLPARRLGGDATHGERS
jgi:RNA polymerase sigma-70 factor (ECF subfamily)